MDNRIIIDEKTRHDYPDWIRRVTAGDGGESYLLLGDTKTALYDCGMAYCGSKLAENVKEELGGRPLDYIILTHSHYDHVGGLPYVMKAFPDAVIAGGAYCADILHRPGALKVIEELGRSAAELYGADPETVTTEGMRVDLKLEEGDVINLGGHALRAIYTPGHTKCSMAFMSEPDHMMLASETLGVLLPRSNEYQPLILKSYSDTIRTIEKCKALDPKYIIMPHFGIVPADKMDKFWELVERMNREEYDFVTNLCRKGADFKELLDAYTDRYFVAGRKAEQAEDAFYANAIPTIKMYAREMGYELKGEVV